MQEKQTNNSLLRMMKLANIVVIQWWLYVKSIVLFASNKEKK